MYKSGVKKLFLRINHRYRFIHQDILLNRKHYKCAQNDT